MFGSTCCDESRTHAKQFLQRALPLTVFGLTCFDECFRMAHTTEFLIGDFNINYLNCSNKKWLHLVELFDLKQMITTPTRVTQNTSSIIDHFYCSNPDYISDCFVPKYSISDYFPICFTRKINSKVKRSCHISTAYQCFKVSK